MEAQPCKPEVLNMLRVVVAIALISSLAGTAWADSVKGSFVVKGKSAGTIAPKAAAAFVVRDRRDMRTPVAEVVLSARAIDTAAAIASLQPHTQAINQDALEDGDYILLWVAPDGHVSMNATFGKTMTQFLDAVGDSLQATLSVNTPDRVAGRVFTPKPVETMGGDRYTVDLTFEAVVARPPAGTALGVGGGAPGKALDAFLATVRTMQWPAIKAALGPTALEMFDKSYNSPEENAASLADILQNWLPKSGLTITGGDQRGDVADLEIEGEMFPGTRALYLARMRQAAGAWRFESAAMLGMLR
jgi:hypothetical protein